ncbi:hypothetical protein X474_23030 [Dethiosulfatarculus sandiegensis]|uniref:Uncharacterized protein n=1 Tax=Dethiosulfatarculus sandiegensis TaxID=1429043 RepID=A0A0D2HMF2_9BACT|nr:hypothetical protein X474_23030 [Dethiosulfatarculus sandiegensis]
MATSPPPVVPEPPEGSNRLQKQAWNYWHELPPKARESRIADAKSAQWMSDKHRKGHVGTHPELSKGDDDRYARISRDILNRPEKIFVGFSDKGFDLLAADRTDTADWRVSVVNLDIRLKSGVPKMSTCYGPKIDKPITWEKKFSTWVI